MTASNRVSIDEIPLERLRPSGDLRREFERVQAPWLRAGIGRWLDLLRPDADWPVVALAAHAGDPAAMLGTVFGVWAPEPLQRFDDLLEGRCATGDKGADRPAGGAWHFIAATTAPGGRGMGLGRGLLGGAAQWVEAQARGAQIRTLSPVVGLPELAGCGPDDADWQLAATDALRRLATADGKPALLILTLHLGAGATLDAILFNSRADEQRSGRVSLRFAYGWGADNRAAQAQRYDRWLADRRRCIADGLATPVPGTDKLLWLPDCDDARVLGPATRADQPAARP